MANPFPFTSGDVLTAADMNSIGAWTAYTPIWTATGTNPVLNNGDLVGQYSEVNNVVVYQFFLTIGSTTTLGSGIWVFSLPVTAATPFKPYARIGYGTAFDVTTSKHRAIFPVFNNLSTTQVLVAVDDGSAADVGPNNPFAFSTSDQLGATVVYRGA